MRLIDADKLKSYFAPSLTGRTEYSADEILLTIMTIPTVDAEPVVRCKECKYLEEDECPWTGVIDWNGYCSRGEKRKESGQNA